MLDYLQPLSKLPGRCQEQDRSGPNNGSARIAG